MMESALNRIIVSTFFFLLATNTTFAQVDTKTKVNLEDVKIKGQSNLAKGMMANRDRMSLESRIKKRKNFREDILEHLPENYEPL